MTRRKRSAPARVAALAVGAGVLSSLAFAGPALAVVPPVGQACHWQGKINGRGATFQKNAQDALFAGYKNDVCGKVHPEEGYVPDPNDPAYPVPPAIPDPFDEMGIYNYVAAAGRPVPLTGSGNGIRAARCRSDAFAGSDNPYTQVQLTDLRGAPPASTHADCAPLNNAVPPFTPPFTPQSSTYPDAADIAAPIMSFPVAGGAVTIAINLQPTPTCPSTAIPLNIQMTSVMASTLFGGDSTPTGTILNWNDPDLRVGPTGPINTALANCDKPVTRVVRSDNSGTTTIFKNYLKNADGARALCDPTKVAGNTWTALSSSANNTVWPGDTAPVPVECSPLIRGAGNPGVITGLQNDGHVGYADLSDAQGSAIPLKLAQLRNQTNTSFVPPRSGTSSNCAFAGALLPGSTASDAVGLNTNVAATWAQDGVPNRSDVTFKSNSYPVCGFTWDLVFTGLGVHPGDPNADPTPIPATPSAISRLDEDQRYTLYSYFTYVLSPLGQAKLAGAGFAPVPAAFLTRLRGGFQAGF